MRPEDVLFWAGGNVLAKYGTVVRRTSPQTGPVETFIRSSPASLVGRDGIIRQAGADRLRVDWLDLDGDGEPEAYLVAEGARTNLLVHSEDLTNAAWVKARCTITPDAATAPDGTLTADKIVLDGTADPILNQIVETGAALENRTFSWSIWAWTDAGQPTEATLFITDRSVTITTSLPVVLATVPQRFDIAFTFPAGALDTALRARIDGKHVPAAGDYFYAWGAQLEEGPFASSYMPTGAATFARAAETPSFAYPHASAALGTIYARIVEGGTHLTGQTGRCIQIGAADNSNPRVILYNEPSAGNHWTVGVGPGSGFFAASSPVSGAIGDETELRAVFVPEPGMPGFVRVQIHEATNGGPEQSGAPSAVFALPAAWSAPLLWLNGKDGEFVGFNRYRDVLMTRTRPSLDEIREFVR